MRPVRGQGGGGLQPIARGSGKFAYAAWRFVNIFDWVGRVRLGVGWVISEPGAQLTVNGGFTISMASFNILEHLDEKPPEGCEPVDGGFSMLVDETAWVKQHLTA
ncbi:hypothetical protein EHI42_08755 [Rhizobium hidalgonense]|uniref:hypothetical protein n=1 Tax=Rhizobium hidalgonense TaxID=1538159 RepID=UPI000FEC5DEC|nr:hypothetical protein [Rhizobium hidalgonense]RWX18293.1 hypothetical protein EHI42_08755 [Rhizobium hidalgonense]